MANRRPSDWAVSGAEEVASGALAQGVPSTEEARPTRNSVVWGRRHAKLL